MVCLKFSVAFPNFFGLRSVKVTDKRRFTVQELGLALEYGTSFRVSFTCNGFCAIVFGAQRNHGSIALSK